jgi:hypothetical protein
MGDGVFAEGVFTSGALEVFLKKMESTFLDFFWSGVAGSEVFYAFENCRVVCKWERVSERRLREEWGVELWSEGGYCA